MPLPEFTRDEQYLITCVKSPQADSQSKAYMWGYILGGAMIAGFGLWFNSIPMLVGAFVFVCGFRIHEEHFQQKWTPHWQSIIAKYEAAALGKAITEDNP